MFFRKTTAPNGTPVTDAVWTYDQGGHLGVLSRVDGIPNGYIRTFDYDPLLRPYRVVTTFRADDAIWPAPANQSRTFVSEYGYDRNLGRVKARRLPSLNLPAGETYALDYDAQGFLIGETELSANLSRGQQYRLVKSMSERGLVTDQVLGNCSEEAVVYDGSAGLAVDMNLMRRVGATSLPASLSTCTPPTQLVRHLAYAHDHFLNLQQSKLNLPNEQATEVYTYDDLQRLTSTSRTWSGTAAPAYTESATYAYDDLGNITSKSDYAWTYTYGSASRPAGQWGPHAVISASKTDGTTATFSYDDNGNMFQGDGRTVDFDLMDRVAQVAQLGATTTFKYAPDGARFQEKVTLSSDPKFGPRTVYSIDKDYELVVWDGSRDTQERSYLGDSVVVTRNATTRSVTYLHKDRLGSIGFLTTHDPAASEREGHDFDPWGKPRARDWTSSGDRLNADDRLAITDFGFTGHEHLDAHYLIHMNGRVYDYRLARFLSVDPIISDPANSQSINPYSYIGNSPLSGTDPTGYQCVRLTGTNICNTVPIGPLTINGNPIPGNVVSGPPTQRTPSTSSTAQTDNGEQGQRAQQANSNPADHGSPHDTAKPNAEPHGSETSHDSIRWRNEGWSLDENGNRIPSTHWETEWTSENGVNSSVAVRVPINIEMRLPADPSGLGPEWTLDPGHRDPNGERYRDPDGRFLDFHKGRPGELGWKGEDHWHDNGDKKHLPPGTEVPDPAPIKRSASDGLGSAGRVVVGGAAVVGGGYLIYRGVRMIPSLFPPLWWTIPANAAVP